MTTEQTAHLQDLKARIDRALFEGDYERCLMDVGQDCSSLLMDPTSPRVTTGEFGRISLATTFMKKR
jgi:hypothetical protein